MLPRVSVQYHQAVTDIEGLIIVVKSRLPSRAPKDAQWLKKAAVAMLESAQTLINEADRVHSAHISKRTGRRVTAGGLPPNGKGIHTRSGRKSRS